MSKDELTFQIFAVACEKAPEERVRYVQGACDGDVELEGRVLELLEYDTRDSFLESPAIDRALLPAQIGPYRVVRLLGAGGMGTVYEAEQESPRRHVALKVVRTGQVDRSVTRRLEHEAAMLARLEHPGIARLYSSGTAETAAGQQPYFAMELIHGKGLLDHAEATRLDTRGRVELLRRVADAVDHAHRHGVIHRDLKPANVLVDETGQPKVLDFGIARLVDSEPATLLTSTGQLLGTLPYMSPEQVHGDRDRVDTRSDVYALGVLLYQLLSGELPHDPKDQPVPALARQIVEHDAPPLERHDRRFRGDLSAIVRQALDRSPHRRYSSAANFAEDLQRFLGHRPVTARAPSALYQLSRVVRRHRWPFALASVLLIAVVGMGVVFFVRGLQLREESERTRRVQSFLEDVLSRPDPLSGAVDREFADVLASAAARISTTFPDEPGIQSDLHLTLGRAYLTIGRLEAARRHFETSRELRDPVFGPDSEEVAESEIALAEVLIPLGHLDEAGELAEHALLVHRRSSAAGVEPRAEALVRLADVRMAQSRYADAETFYRDALELRRGAVEHDPLDIAETLDRLGQLLRRRGRYDEAFVRMQEAHTIRVERLGERHPLVASSLDSLGGFLSRTDGRLGLAEDYLSRAVGLRRELLGPKHPDLAISLARYGTLLTDLGRWAAAHDALSEALEIRRRSLGERHPSTAGSWTRLGRYHVARSEWNEARDALETALEIYRENDLDRHIRSASAHWAMGRLVYERREWKEAESWFRAALAIARDAYSPSNERIGGYLNDVGLSLRRQGRYDEAEAFYLEALELRRSALPGDHVVIMESLQYLAWLYRDLHRFEEARSLFLESLAMGHRLFGARDRSLIDPLRGLGVVLVHSHEEQEGEARLTHALELAREHYSTPHAKIAGTLADLGHARLRQGALDASREAYRESLEQWAALTGAASLDYSTVLQGLGDVEAAADAWEAAHEYYCEALEIRREHPGSTDDRVHSSLRRVARSLEALGRFDEARESLDEMLSIAERSQRPADLARSLTTFGTFERRRDRAEEAQALLRRGVAMAIEAWGEESPAVAYRKSELGWLLLDDLDQPREAESLLLDALRIREAHFGAMSDALIPILNGLAQCAEKRHDPDGALRHWQRSLHLARNASPPKVHQILLRTLSVGTLLLELDRPEAAVPFLQETVALRREQYGAQSDRFTTASRRLGVALTQCGQFVEAERAFRSALEGRIAARGESSLWVGSVRRSLAELYRKKGDPDSAVQELREALRWRTRSRGASPTLTAEIESELAESLSALSQWAEAESLASRAFDQLLDRVGAEDERTRLAHRRLTAIRERVPFDPAEPKP